MVYGSIFRVTSFSGTVLNYSNGTIIFMFTTDPQEPEAVAVAAAWYEDKRSSASCR